MKGEVKEGYKMTEIGEIPIEWKVKKFNDVLESIIDFRGRTPKKIGMEWGNGCIPALSANNVKMGKIDLTLPTYYGSKKLYERWMGDSKLQKGDVIMTMEAPLGNVAQIPDDREYILSQRVVAFKTKANIDNCYFKYLLMSKRTQTKLKMYSTGTTAKGISQKNLFKIKLPIPPLKEQQKIASILSTVDEHIEQTDKLIEKTKELKKGLMQKLLTKGIGHTEFKKTEIGEIPKEWEIKKLKQLADIVKGKKPKQIFYEFDENLKPYILVETCISREYTIYTNDTNCSLCSEEDILLLWDGSRAGLVFYGFRGYIGSTVAAIKIINKNKVYSKYLYYFLDSKVSYIQDNTAGTGIPHVQKDVVNNILISLPPLQEQQKIASILSEVDNQIEQYQLKKEKLETLKKGLMQQLLTGKKRVKVQ